LSADEPPRILEPATSVEPPDVIVSEPSPAPAPVAPPGAEALAATATVFAQGFTPERAAALNALQRDALRHGTTDDTSARAWSEYLLGLEDALAARLLAQGESTDNEEPIQDSRRAVLRMLAPILRADQTARLTPALRDAATRPDALAALDRIEDPAVVAYLQDRVLLGLPDERRDIITTLGRRDNAAVAEFLADFARASADNDVVWSCIESLSRMGVPPARAGISAGALTPEESRRYAACTLRAAHVLLDAGNTEQARGLFRGFVSLTAPSHQVRAALLGLAACGQEGLAAMLIGFLPDPALRDTAARLLPGALDAATAQSLRDTFEQLPPGSQAALLRVTDRDGAPIADVPRLAVESPHTLVRFEAARASGALPDIADAYEMSDSGPPALRHAALEAVLEAALALPPEEAKPWLYRMLEDEAPAWARQRAIAQIGERGDASDLERLASMQLPEAFGPVLTTAFDKLFIQHGDGDAAAASAAAMMTRAMAWEEVDAIMAQARERGWPLNELFLRSGIPTAWTSSSGAFVAETLPTPWPQPAPLPLPQPEGEGEGTSEAKIEGQAEGEGEPALPEPPAPIASVTTEILLPEWRAVFLHVWPGSGIAVKVNQETKSLTTADERSGGWSRAAAALKPGRNIIEITAMETPPEGFALRMMDREGGALDLTQQRLPEDGLNGVGAASPRVRNIIDAIP